MKKLDFTKMFFVLSLCFASLGYGFAASQYQFFPYSLVKDAGYAFDAVRQSIAAKEPLANERERLPGTIVRSHGESSQDDLILVSGGPGYMQPYAPPDGCVAWLMNREGKIKHVWRYDSTLWDDLQEVIRPPGKKIFPLGLFLFPNGDLLVSYHGEDCWPYGIGMAKFDASSNLLWKKELHSHHWFTVGDDGRIYSAAQRVVTSPYILGKTNVRLASREGKLLSDVLLILSPEGEIIEEVSMLDSLVESGWVGLFQGAADPDTPDKPNERIATVTWDPLHLNEVRLVTDEQARSHPLLKAGDLLVSFRSINTVAILDGSTKRTKWVSAGLTVRQHSPRLQGDGVLVFDNWGGDAESGGSRIARIDLSTGSASTLFPRRGVELPGPFFTQNTGRVDLHPDGQRMLLTVTHRGTIWEVDLASGKVVWEYIYTHPDNPGPRSALATAEYVGPVTFPMSHDGGVR